MNDALIHEAERALRRIEGVAEAAIDHEDGEIQAIHVLTYDARPPKQIARDVVSSLRTALRITVDHKKVSVARLSRSDAPEDPSAAEPIALAPVVTGADGPRRRAHGTRVQVRSIMVRDVGREREAEVVLGSGGREARGTVRGVGTGVRSARLMARATVNALGRFLTPSNELDIEHVSTVPLGSGRVVLVTVSVMGAHGEDLLVGCSWAGEDIGRKTVFATLDAVNRVFGRLEQRQHVEYEVGPTSPEEMSEARNTV